MCGFAAQLNTGGRDYPRKDSSMPTSVRRRPPGIRPHRGVDGRRMIVWGGGTWTAAMGGRGLTAPRRTWSPDPVRGHTVCAVSPHRRLDGPRMIVWGGSNPPVTNNGGVFSPPQRPTVGPAPTAVEGAPSARTEHTAVWTGARMIVWGGLGRSEYLEHRRRCTTPRRTALDPPADGASKAHRLRAPRATPPCGRAPA